MQSQVQLSLREKQAICACAVAVLLLSGCFGPVRASAPAAPPPPGPQRQQVRVLVYNIHAGADAAGVNNLDRVGEIIRKTNADVVLLQEVDRGVERSGRVDEVKEIERRTGLHGVLGKTLDYQGGDYGIATFSRWEINTSHLEHLPVTPVQTRAGGSHEPRGALVVEVTITGRHLTVINTHLDASREETYRMQEADEVISLAYTEWKKSTVLVGGDFNSEPDSAVQQKVHDSLHDLWPKCGGGQDLTYPADVPRKRIDYLFSSGDIKCDSAKVLETQASDHRPVLFTLELR